MVGMHIPTTNLYMVAELKSGHAPTYVCIYIYIYIYIYNGMVGCYDTHSLLEIQPPLF